MTELRSGAIIRQLTAADKNPQKTAPTSDTRPIAFLKPRRSEPSPIPAKRSTKTYTSDRVVLAVKPMPTTRSATAAAASAAANRRANGSAFSRSTVPSPQANQVNGGIETEQPTRKFKRPRSSRSRVNTNGQLQTTSITQPNTLTEPRLNGTVNDNNDNDDDTHTYNDNNNNETINHKISNHTSTATNTTTTTTHPKANQNLIPKNKSQPAEEEEDNDDDLELTVLSTKVPLTDIISGRRIGYCCKTIHCTHVSCFDFNSFIEMYPDFADSFDQYDNNRIIRFSVIHYKEDPKVFQVKQIKKQPYLAPRKFTRSKKKLFTARCPICACKFIPNDLIFDDFMHVVLENVDKDVKLVDIDDDWKVRPIVEEPLYDNAEVISLDDDEEDAEDDDDDEDDDDEIDIIEEPFVLKKRRKITIPDSDPLEEIENDIEDIFHDFDSSLSDLFSEPENTGTADDPVLID